MTHLFLFTLGPVQSFIAQARKTQDLYAGSQILSDLTSVARQAVGEKNIIFPKRLNLDIDNEHNSIPNRFIAEVNLSDGETPQKFGKEVEGTVRSEWERLAMNVLFEQGLNAKKFTLPNGFQEQIRQHLAIQWVLEPFAGAYKAAYEKLEQSMSGIKNTTVFKQYNVGTTFGETGRKCSVDGQRNIKFYRRSERQQNWKDDDIRERYLFNKGENENVLFDFESKNLRIPISLIQPGEGLSAVSFVKRGYLKEEFSSTAEIALLKTLASLEKEDLNDFFSPFPERNIQLLYEENLNEKYFRKQGYNQAAINDLQNLQKQQQELKKQAKNAGYNFCKYYAILLFDGDNMGKLLDGSLLKSEDLKTFHGEFSERLSIFASAAKKYLDKGNRGCTVYAGGDDFLGFVNLECLLEVLIELRQLYHKEVYKPLESWFTEEISFSAGICIAHYKEPLSLVLGKARAMEQKAKDFREAKNAFAIAVMKGSGEDHETVWGFENNNVKRLHDLVNLLRKETFSNTFIKSFQREFAPILNEKEQVPKKMQAMLQTEFTRLTERSCDLKSKKEEAAKLCKTLWMDFFLLQQKEAKEATLDNFFEMLNICDFLHRTLNPIVKPNPALHENPTN